MTAITSCPQCRLQLSVPDEADSTSEVKCPVCRTQFMLRDATIAPVLEMIVVRPPADEAPPAEPAASALSPEQLLEEDLHRLRDEDDDSSELLLQDDEPEEHTDVDDDEIEAWLGQESPLGRPDVNDPAEDLASGIVDVTPTAMVLPQSAAEEVQTEVLPAVEDLLAEHSPLEEPAASDSGVDRRLSSRDTVEDISHGATIEDYDLHPEELSELEPSELDSSEWDSAVEAENLLAAEQPFEEDSEAYLFEASGDTGELETGELESSDTEMVDHDTDQLEPSDLIGESKSLWSDSSDELEVADDEDDALAYDELADTEEDTEEDAVAADLAGTDQTETDAAEADEDPNAAPADELLAEEPPVQREPWHAAAANATVEFSPEESLEDEAEYEVEFEDELAIEDEADTAEADIADTDTDEAEPAAAASEDREADDAETSESAEWEPYEALETKTTESSPPRDWLTEDAAEPDDELAVEPDTLEAEQFDLEPLDEYEPPELDDTERAEAIATEQAAAPDFRVVEQGATSAMVEVAAEEPIVPGIPPATKPQSSRLPRRLWSLLGISLASVLGLGVLAGIGWLVMIFLFNPAETASSSTVARSTRPVAPAATPPTIEAQRASFEQPIESGNASGSPFPSEPAPLDEPAATPIAGSGSHVAGAPSYSMDQLAVALSTAKANRQRLVDGSLAQAERRRDKAAGYVAFCDLAEALTYFQDDPERADRTLIILESKDLFRDALTGDQVRDDVSRLAAGWMAKTNRPHNGIFLHGRLSNVRRKGSVFEYTLETSPGQMVSFLLPERLDRSRYQQGAEVVVAGSLLSDPASRVSGYTGNSEQVIWAATCKLLGPPTRGARQDTVLPF